ncbi:hypothetical protein ABZP36_001265 [Zizania latifolia]
MNQSYLSRNTCLDAPPPLLYPTRRRPSDNQQPKTEQALSLHHRRFLVTSSHNTVIASSLSVPLPHLLPRLLRRYCYPPLGRTQHGAWEYSCTSKFLEKN